jgi:hypothetical protein
MQLETEFYRRDLDVLGQYYYRPLESAASYQDILFFCLYTARLLVEKKFLIPEAKELQKQLALGKELEKVVSWAEDRPYTLPYQWAEFRGSTKTAFSASMIIDKSVYFRYGYCGFGVFSRYKKLFGQCAFASVYALLETIYKEKKQDRKYLEMLWQAALALSRLEFGTDIHNKNCLKVAQRIYVETTQDFFPGVDYK